MTRKGNRFSRGKYTIKNPEKYIGKSTPIYRSGWENQFMMYLDNNPKVKKWASEALSIQYVHPFEKDKYGRPKKKPYIPDFYVEYEDKDGKIIKQVIEIKPKSQIHEQFAGRSKRNQIQVAINKAKWKVARHFCQQNGLDFVVITEDVLHQGK